MIRHLCLVYFFLMLFCPALVIAKGAVVIKIQPVFRGKPLLLGDKTYVTENGDPLTIEEFKFYLSNVSMTGSSRLFFETKSAHLINAADSNALLFRNEDVPAGVYSTLGLNIGIDSATNMAGALSGDLDPTLGMYWAWNTGYINAKLTGHSPMCQAAHNKFEFHIGGYLEPYNTIKKVTLKLNEVRVENGGTTTITLFADAAAWLKGLHLVSMNNVVTPSKEALRIAENYAGMLEVKPLIEGEK